MILPDVNVLIYAHRAELPQQKKFRVWLEEVINGDAAFGLSELVLSAFVRIVTHPKLFHPPPPIDKALAFAEGLLAQPNCTVISPGDRHWGIFAKLCRTSQVRGNLVPDAYFAALAIESGCEWVTTDRDFNRFKDLKVSNPA